MNSSTEDVTSIDNQQAFVSNVAGIVSSAVALFAALCVLGISLLLYIDTRTRHHVTGRLSFRLILISLASSVFYDIAYIISDLTTEGFWCGASVWGIVFFQLFSNFLVACIAINVVVVMSSLHLFAARDTWLQWYYIGGSFLLSAGASVIPIPGGHYGYEPLEQTCWFVVLGDQQHALVYSLSSLFIWQFLVALICLVCVVIVIYRATSFQKIVQSTQQTSTRRSMLGPRSAPAATATVETVSKELASHIASLHSAEAPPLGASTIRLSEAPKIKISHHRSLRLARNSTGRAGGTRSENDVKRQSISNEMESRNSFMSYDHEYLPRSPTQAVQRKTANEYISELMTTDEAILRPEELLPSGEFSLPPSEPLFPLNIQATQATSPRSQNRWSRWRSPLSPTTRQSVDSNPGLKNVHSSPYQYSYPPVSKKRAIEPRVVIVRSKARRIIRQVALRVMLYPGALLLFSVWAPISDLFSAVTGEYNWPIYLLAFLTGGGAGLAYAIIALAADPTFVKGTKAWWTLRFGNQRMLHRGTQSEGENGLNLSDNSDQERKRVVAAM